jgi:hypothetical protein
MGVIGNGGIGGEWAARIYGGEIFRAVTKFILSIFRRSMRARAISPRWLCGNATLSVFASTRVARWKHPIRAFLLVCPGVL